VILIALFVCFFHIFNRNQDEVQEPTFTALLSKIEEKKVRQVNVRGNTYSGTFEDTKERFRTIGPPADSVMLQKLRESGRGREVREGGAEQPLAHHPRPVDAGGVPLRLLRPLHAPAAGTGGKAMTFGKSKAKLLSESHNKVTFADVAGIDECKEELEEIIAFLKDPRSSPSSAAASPRAS
jgi:cell division protease FtsH